MSDNGYPTGPDGIKVEISGAPQGTAHTINAPAGSSFSDGELVIPSGAGGASSVTGTAPISVAPTTGDVVVSHDASGVSAGLYDSVDVNVKGHVTGGYPLVFDVRASYGGNPGATGDGTTDDGAAIQRAIDAAVDAAGTFATRAGVVRFPPTTGSWKIATPITLTLTQAGAATADAPGFTVIGSGKDGPIKFATGAGSDAFTVTHNNMEWGRIRFAHLFFLGTGAATDCRDGLFVQVAPSPATCEYYDVEFGAVYAAQSPWHLKGGVHILRDCRNSGSTAAGASQDLIYLDETYRTFVDGFYSYSELMFRGVDYPGGAPTRGLFRVKPIDDSQGKTSVYIRRFDAPTHNNFPYLVYTAADGGAPNIDTLLIEDFRAAPTTDLILASDEIENIVLRNGMLYSTDAVPLANLFGGACDFVAENVKVFGGGTATFANTTASNVTLIDTSLSAITNALGTVRTSASGAETVRNDSITTGQTAGITLQNKTDATSGNQKYSPMLVFDARGHTGAASQTVKAWEQLQPSQAANALATIAWYLQNGSQSDPGTVRMALTEVHPIGAFGGLPGRSILRLNGATASYLTFANSGLITDEAASYTGIGIGSSLAGTVTLVATGADRAHIDSASFRPATANALLLGSNAAPWKRLHIEGTAHVAGDWGTLTGWGTGATVSAVTGDDNHFTVQITAGTTPSANPTATLTFKDGTWTGAPWALCNLEATSDGTVVAPWTTCSTTATTLVLAPKLTPVDTKTYTFRGLVIGG